MGIWGGAYGPEGSRHLVQASESFAASKSQVIFDGPISAYHSPLHRQSVYPSSNMTVTSLPRARDHPLFYVGIYSLIGLASVIVDLLSTIAMFLGALRASRLLFKRLLIAVVHATMRWHVSLCLYRVCRLCTYILQDTTPQGWLTTVIRRSYANLHQNLGRMLNRFGKVRIHTFWGDTLFLSR